MRPNVIESTRDLKRYRAALTYELLGTLIKFGSLKSSAFLGCNERLKLACLRNCYEPYDKDDVARNDDPTGTSPQTALNKCKDKYQRSEYNVENRGEIS